MCEGKVNGTVMRIRSSFNRWETQF